MKTFSCTRSSETRKTRQNKQDKILVRPGDKQNEIHWSKNRETVSRNSINLRRDHLLYDDFLAGNYLDTRFQEDKRIRW